MKNITEIINEMQARKIPHELGEITAYIKTLKDVSSSTQHQVSLLITSARRSCFKSPNEWQTWAQKDLGLTRSYVCHCNRVGTMLLDAKSDLYGKLSPLSFDKLLAIARLQADELESYARSKDLAQISRDEVRSDVSRLLGEPVKATEPKHKIDDAPTYTMRDMTREAAKMSPEAMCIMAESSTPEQLREMIDAGQSLFGMGLKTLLDKKLESDEDLNLLKQYCDAMSQQVAERQAARAKTVAEAQIEQEEHYEGALK